MVFWRKEDAMAIVRIPDEQRTLSGFEDVRGYLHSIGIDYERWRTERPLPCDATSNQILDAYSGEIDRLKKQGGYTTADVIDIHSDTPGLEAMLAKFNIEHWHDEDEVRYIIAGRGLFHIHTEGGAVVAIEVGEGDLIRVPRGTRHWFDLCGDRRIRAIRLFQDTSGWTPHYTDSGVDRNYDPVCLGPAYLPPQPVTK
jgi:1,2-dihydroxy-3-keto-5-methylthiopentene dioxygenase